MKKLVLALLMTLCTLGALRAQSLQSDIMSFLRTEGYSPSYDSDGDIQFKKEGYLYYVIVKDIDDGYSYVEVRVPFGISDMSLSELQNIASELNTAKFLCKCSAYRDDSDGDNIFQIGMEFVASTSSQAARSMPKGFSPMRCFPARMTSPYTCACRWWGTAQYTASTSGLASSSW